MRNVCLFYSQDSKVIWLSNMADTFIEKFTRYAKACGLLFSWLCFSGADWLGRRTPVTWLFVYTLHVVFASSVCNLVAQSLLMFLTLARTVYFKEALSVLMLCAPCNRRRPFSYHTKMTDFEYFRVLLILSWKNKLSWSFLFRAVHMLVTCFFWVKPNMT